MFETSYSSSHWTAQYSNRALVQFNGEFQWNLPEQQHNTTIMQPKLAAQTYDGLATNKGHCVHERQKTTTVEDI